MLVSGEENKYNKKRTSNYKLKEILKGLIVIIASNLNALKEKWRDKYSQLREQMIFLVLAEIKILQFSSSIWVFLLIMR